MRRTIFVSILLCFISVPLCSANQEGRPYRTVFVRDVTLEDGTLVAPNKKLQKIWEVENKGTQILKDIYLTRVGTHDDPTQIRSELRTRQKDSKPGEIWPVKVDITTPKNPGTYRAEFKMAHKNGVLLAPKMSPLYVEIEVVKP